MEQTMFDTLLSLPLFQGLGHSDLTRILESTRMEFTTAKAGSAFLRQGEVCEGLTFIIEGHVLAETMSADRHWSVTEDMSLPEVVGTNVLYGSQRTYGHSYTALRPTRLLQMDKRTAAALTSYFEVFRLNLLNLLSTSIVRREQLLWLPPAVTLEDRIIAFLRAHVCRPAGRKFFKVPLTILGAYLGEDPRYISKALHRLEESGYLKLGRRLIEIPAFELLIKRNERK